jgi:hypothetical protein
MVLLWKQYSTYHRLGFLSCLRARAAACVLSRGYINGRDESGSDWIMPLTHPHPYFFVGCGVERILHECGYKCGFFWMSDMVRSQIDVGADVD